MGVLGARGQVAWQPTWLFDVLLYGVQRVAGEWGLAAWRALWAGVTMALALRLVFLVGAASWSAVLLAPLVLAVARPSFEARPEGLLGALLLAPVVLLESARRLPRDRTRWTIPLQAAWANLHGGWIMGPLVVGLYAAADFVGGVAARFRAAPEPEVGAGEPPPAPATAEDAAPASRSRGRPWAALAIVLLGTSAIVPSPLLNLSRPLRFLGDALRDPITGDVRLEAWTLQGQHLDSFNVLLAVAVIALVAGLPRIWRASPPLLLLTAALLVLTLMGLPLRPALAWVAFAPLGMACMPLAAGWPQRLRMAPAALAGIAGFGFLVFAPQAAPGIGHDPASVPERSTALADSARLEGPMLNSLAAGGYVRWIRGDRHPPLLDSRGLGSFELRRLLALADSDPVALDSLQEAWGFTHAILRPPVNERDRLALNLSRRTEWAMVQADDGGMLFVRYRYYPGMAYARAYRYFTPDNLAMLDMMERGRRDSGLVVRLEQELERARRESPRHARASYWLGELAQIRGEQSVALRHFEEAARLDPALPGLAMKMGLLYESVGDQARARRAYRLAARDPSDRKLALSLLRDLGRH